MYITVRAADLRYLMDTYVDHGRTIANSKRGDVVYQRLWQALEDSGVNPYIYDEALYKDAES